MGDSTTMTIDFLRARLLSERSVSRAARQRADQLAKRVTELEERLRLVTLQRKKAEKAAAEVLSILEAQGIDDLLETVDSSSDEEEFPCDDTLKEYESSAASRVERSGVENGHSGSEPEVSNSQGTNLSWKSNSTSPDSHEKQREKQIRQRQRRRSFTSTSQTSPKHQLGKSCRKIKRREMRSEADMQNPALLDTQRNGGVTCFNYSNNQPNASKKASRGMVEAVADVSDSHHEDDHNGEFEAHLYANGSERDEVMERVLEQQAKLIGQFQAEENAQREWEDNYNENNITILADYEPGNQSFIAENSNQSKKELTEPANGTSAYVEESKLRVLHLSSTEDRTTESISGSEKKDRGREASNIAFSNCSMPRASKQCDGMAAKETKTIYQECAVSAPECCGIIKNGKQNEKLIKDLSVHRYPSNSMLIIEDTSSRTSFPVDESKLPKLGPQQKNQTHAPTSSLGGVLEALQRAKLSLRRGLSKPSPFQNTFALTAPASHTRAVASFDGLNIPTGSASLFKLPTDSFPSAHLSAPKFYGSGLSLPANHPEVGYVSSSSGHQNMTSTCVEGESRVTMGKEYLFHNHISSSVGISDSNRYSQAYSDVSAERASFHSEVSKSLFRCRMECILEIGTLCMVVIMLFLIYGCCN